MADDEVEVGEERSDSIVNENTKNQQMFLTILENIHFLARKGLAFPGNEDQGN